jgi:hypothetical protein
MGAGAAKQSRIAGGRASQCLTAREVKDLVGDHWDESRFDGECAEDGTILMRRLNQLQEDLDQAAQQEAEDERGLERIGLSELFGQNGGATWNVANNWCVDGVAVKLWHGVATNADGNICELDLSNQALANLEGFQALAGLRLLETLDLSNNPDLSDLTPLCSVNQLKKLTLKDGAWNDLAALGNLVKLEVLNLDYCERVHDLTALASLKELRECSLVGMTRVINIDPLFGLKKVRSLGMPGATTDEWVATAVKVWPKMEKLDLTVCAKLTKAALFTLLQLRELKRLDLHPKCFCITELSDVWLKILNGFAGNVADLDLEKTVGITSDKLSAVVRSCKQLVLFKDIQIGRSKIDNKVLRSYMQVRPHLHDADFRSCIKINSVALFQPAALSLRILDVSDTSIKDIVPLAHFAVLSRLSLADTQVSDLSPLATVKTLEHLSLRGCWRLVDITPLSHAKGLLSLSLGYTHVSDLSPLASTTAVHTLDLEGSRVVDVSVLAKLKGLR